jgi:uncharacterized membrane protein YdjX (TVP38/TMEM64 family)
MIASGYPNARRWIIVGLAASAFVLVPFILFGERLDAWAGAALERTATKWIAFGLVVSLHVLDIVLPIPSSIVSTMSGALLGAAVGTVASWIGMTLGCMLGYVTGSLAGRPIVRRLAGLSLEELERDMGRYGVALVAIGRPVPVLAEATTLVAGATRMDVLRFLAVAALANFGISIVYAVTGAYSLRVGSFLLAMVASMVVPALALWSANRVLKRA